MRGYKMSDIEEGEGDSKFKIFWLGVIEGITWNFSRKLPDSDSRANYSLGERINCSTSGYYGELCLCSTKIDVTNYSTLWLTIPTYSGGGEIKVGITNNNGFNKTFTKTVSGATNHIVDISSLNGNYYIKIYMGSGNRSSNSIAISHIWLEK